MAAINRGGLKGSAVSQTVAGRAPSGALTAAQREADEANAALAASQARLRRFSARRPTAAPPPPVVHAQTAAAEAPSSDVEDSIRPQAAAPAPIEARPNPWIVQPQERAVQGASAGKRSSEADGPDLQEVCEKGASATRDSATALAGFLQEQVVPPILEATPMVMAAVSSIAQRLEVLGNCLITDASKCMHFAQGGAAAGRPRCAASAGSGAAATRSPAERGGRREWPGRRR